MCAHDRLTEGFLIEVVFIRRRGFRCRGEVPSVTCQMSRVGEVDLNSEWGRPQGSKLKGNRIRLRRIVDATPDDGERNGKLRNTDGCLEEACFDRVSETRSFRSRSRKFEIHITGRVSLNERKRKKER